MKKLLLSMAVLINTTILCADSMVTMVYENTFITGTQKSLDGVAMGTPKVTFTTSTYGVVGDAPTLANTQADGLHIPNTKAKDATGYNMVTAPIAGFDTPFANQLDQIKADSVMWIFNFRSNNQYGSKGFGEGQSGYANVLVADGNNLITASGYAVVLGGITSGNGEKTIKLVRFAGGLDNNNKITNLLSSGPLTAGKYWSVRVIYTPATNTWKLAVYENTTEFVDPTEVTVWTDCGSIVDYTYTHTPMTTFGFLCHYNGNNNNIMFVKNFRVMTFSEPPVQRSIYYTSYKSESSVGMNGKSKGTPSVTYTQYTSIIEGAQPDEPKSTADGLTIYNYKASGARGRNMLTAPVAKFATPYSAILNTISADSIAWSFNMRNTRTNYCSGFNDDGFGFAVVLAATNANLTQGNGYALILGDKSGTNGNPSKKYRLIYYTDGLTANNHTKTIISSDTIGLKEYTTVRIVYVPTSNKWKLYAYADKTEFVKPVDCSYTFKGEAIDDHYTSVELPYFGFMNKYNGNNEGNLRIANFSIDAHYYQDTLYEGQDNTDLLEEKDGQTVNIELHRNLKKDTWNTICLPFDMTSDQIREAFGADCQLAQLLSATMEDETLILDFDDNLSSIEAGMPYLIQPKKNVTTPVTVFDVTLNKDAQTIDKGLATMVGVFSPTTLEVSKNTLFLGAENTLYYVSEESDLPGLRAYFTLTDAAAKAAKHCVKIGRVPTDINVLPSTTNTHAMKRIVNGQFIIEREGVKYNAEGVRLQ